MKLPFVVYIVAAHNESSLLKAKMGLIAAATRDLPIAGLVVVENGSTDNTYEICQQIQREFTSLKVVIAQEPIGDLGQAWARGLREAAAQFPLENHFHLLTAADLPFDFTDIHEFLKHYRSNPIVDVVIGSKGHPKSVLKNTLPRRLMSMGYFLLRFLLLGLKQKDTQGTVFIRASKSMGLLQATHSSGFFFSTELIYRAHQQKCLIAEVPVVLRQTERKSSVRALRDSWRMFKALVQLSLK